MSKQQSKAPATLLRHVVLFTFSDTATPAQIQDIEKSFCDLPDKIDEIYDFEAAGKRYPKHTLREEVKIYAITWSMKSTPDFCDVLWVLEYKPQTSRLRPENL